MLRRASTNLARSTNVSACYACSCSARPNPFGNQRAYASAAFQAGPPRSALLPEAATRGVKSVVKASGSTHEPVKRQWRPKHPTRDAYNLAARIEQFCQSDRLDNAVELLRRSSRDAINAAVYNILIREVLRKKKNNLAYELWMEMKKGGVTPTPQSYTTFFASVDPASVSAGLIERIKTIYSQWVTLCSKPTPEDSGLSVSDSDVASETLHYTSRNEVDKLSAIPTNAYLTLLSRLEHPDLDGMLAVLNTMPKSGALSPTKETYTLLLFALTRQSGKHLRSEASKFRQLSASIEAIWKRYEAAFRDGKARMDARSVTPLLRFWLQKATMDKHDVKLKDEVLTAIERLFGLMPTAASKARESLLDREERPRRVQLDAHAFYGILQLLRAFGLRKLLGTWFEQARSGELAVGRRRESLIASRHCELMMTVKPDAAEELLIWMLRNPSQTVRPELSTYQAVIRSAQGEADLASALRVLAHMSGANDALLLPTEERLLRPIEGQASKRASKGYHTKMLAPDAAIMADFLEVAKATRDWRKLDRALTVAQHFGHFIPEISGPSVVRTAESHDEQALRDQDRLHNTLLSVVEALLRRSTSVALSEPRRRSLASWYGAQNT